LENIRSLQTDVPGILRYFNATGTKLENFSVLVFHHTRGFDVGGRSGC